MRRLLIIGLALVFLTTLIGCGETATPVTQQPSTPSEQPAPVPEPEPEPASEPELIIPNEPPAPIVEEPEPEPQPEPEPEVLLEWEGYGGWRTPAFTITSKPFLISVTYTGRPAKTDINLWKNWLELNLRKENDASFVTFVTRYEDEKDPISETFTIEEICVFYLDIGCYNGEWLIQILVYPD